MTSNDELIAEARKVLEDYPNYQEYHGGPLLKYPHQDALLKVTHALEAAESRIAELEAEAKEFRIDRIHRIGELQELAEAEARIAELEAGEWEYAQAVITDDEGGLYLGKSFGDDPTRALDEGYVLVRRSCGPWVPVESEGTDD